MIRPIQLKVAAAVLVSGEADWQELRRVHDVENAGSALRREFFTRTIERRQVVFVNLETDAVAAAALAQYAVDRWQPGRLISVGSPGEAVHFVADRNVVPLLHAESIDEITGAIKSEYPYPVPG